MSKNIREHAASIDTHIKAADRLSFVTIAFNAGLLLFVLEGFWQLLHGPFDTWTEHRLHVGLFYFGLGLAAVMWIVSSRNSRGVNWTLTLVAVTVVLLATVGSIRQFDRRQRELLRGTVIDGRVVYPGLGLSFAAPAGWQMNLQPSIAKRSKVFTDKKLARTCIQYGETAVFFQAVPPTDSADLTKTVDSIQIEGEPFIFRSLGRTLVSIRQLESSYQSMAGVKILRPMRFYHLENLDFADFDVLDETNQILYRHVFARSGETRLDFVLTTSGEKTPARFDEFVRSVRITRRPTQFND